MCNLSTGGLFVNIIQSGLIYLYKTVALVMYLICYYFRCSYYVAVQMSFLTKTELKICICVKKKKEEKPALRNNTFRYGKPARQTKAPAQS